MITEPLKFLGALVSRVDVSMGWGGEPGYCNIDLVEDPDNGYIFDPPPLGTGCIFKFGQLSFGGILKRYNNNESVSSGRTYSVVLESPNNLLTGVILVLRNFQGTVYTDDQNITNLAAKPVMTYGGDYPTNIINLYADKENYEYGGLFGAADNNSMGYPVSNIVADLKQAEARGNFSGKLLFSGSSYSLDLSELEKIALQIPLVRINQQYTDLISLISQICEYANYSFTFNLDGDVDSRGVIQLNAKITVKMLSKASPPNKNVISQIIEEFKNKPDLQKNLVSYSKGKEYADIPTQKILFGGAASRYWLADYRHIYPIWGSIGQGINSTYFGGTSIYEYNNPFASIKITVDGGFENNFTWVETTPLELRCALGGRQCWTAYHLLMAFKEGRQGITFGNFQITQSDFTKLLAGELCPNDLCDTTIENAENAALWLYGDRVANQTYAQRWVNARYNAVLRAASSFYGREFLVAVPGEVGGKENSFRWIKLDQKQEDAWSLANSAWAGDNASLEFPDIKFFDEDGRLQPVAIYPNLENADYSSLNSDYGRTTLGTNYGVLTGASLDTNFGTRCFDIDGYALDKGGNIKKDSRGNPVRTKTTSGFVRVSVEALPVYDSYSSYYNGFNSLCSLILGVDVLPNNHCLFGFSNLDFAMPPAMLAPEYLGVPQESQRYVWGPWFAFNDAVGNVGRVEISEDSEMRPEAFGSIEGMNKFASEIVRADLASLVESEEGEVQIAEVPAFNLAERFYSSGPYVTAISITADPSGGFQTSYRFSTWTTNFGKLSKYNLDMLRKSRSEWYKFQKKIFDLFRKKPPQPIRANLLGLFERKIPRVLPSSNLIAGNFFNAIANNINAEGKKIGVNVNAVTMEEGMKVMGLNPLETFGASFEQMFTPAFLFNQNDPDGVKSEFNRFLEEPEQ